MAIETIESPDLERERQQRIDGMTADHGPGWAEQYRPGSFGCHELLDRTELVAGLVDRYVLDHPSCLQDPEWFALAEQAVTALAELYQRIGEKHLSAKSPARGKR